MEGSKRRVVSGSVVVPAGNSNRNQAGAADFAPTTPTIPAPGRQAEPGPASNTNLAPPAQRKRRCPSSSAILLDTATLTDIRRVEASGAAAASPLALERAAAALRARADWLDAQSRTMRARAQAK